MGFYVVFKKNLSIDEIYKKYLKNPIIIDVGANEGQSINRFSLIFNDCIIHSFEPIKKCFDRMIKYYPNKKFIKNNYALSDKNTNKKFFINKHSYTSSFSKINKNYNEFNKKNKIVKTSEVKTLTLDTYINLYNIKKIDILKIDTQGHELHILKGAKNVLKKSIINFIEVEIILCNYYEININLHEVDNIMYKNNYNLFSLQNFSYDKNSQIRWFDMLYINRNFYNDEVKK